MPTDSHSDAEPLWRAIVWVLRITVALQCVGNWRWLTQIEETPLLALLWGHADVGGLGWDESAALAAGHAIGWLTLAAGLCVLVRPTALLLVPLALLQLLFAVAMWRTGGGFALQIDWLPLPIAALFPLATQSARIAAPLGLMLLDPWLVERPLSPRRVSAGIGLLRWAAALTFVAHGIEAWQHYPVHVDLLIDSLNQTLGIRLSQAAAEHALTAFGMVDVLVALACVGTRLRWVLWWMVLWGAITAASRTLAYGWEIAWHETATRVSHLGAPLAVVLYWHLVSWSSDTAEEAEPLDKSL